MINRRQLNTHLATAGAAVATVAFVPSLLGCASPEPAAKATPDGPWQLLPTAAFRGKQDDMHFVTPSTGWYANGDGHIYGTTSGGQSWQLLHSRPGTYWRTVGFVDNKLGFAGNIGTDYFPGVTDPTALYRTSDGGNSWAPVSISGPPIKGLCAIDVLHTPYINAGVLAQRTVIHAAGRVGGPAVLLRSLDAGATWVQVPLPASVGMVQDVKFFDAANGLLFAGSDADVQRANALVMLTNDGGNTWREVYRSTRPYEIMWKGHFPSRNTGYATVQSYNPDTSASQRVVIKSTDGGRSWVELPLVNDHSVREFGVAFATPSLGWVGANSTGYETRDGGNTWAPVAMGRAVNKIRVLPTATGFVAYAIGSQVHKLTGTVVSA
jgi:photosystem II stability/assembly factor-like uncharacterized protein